MDWFYEKDEDSGFEMVVRFRHRQKEYKRCLKPSVVKHRILASAMSRMVSCFESDTFGVVSSFRPGLTRKKDIERQYRLLSVIRDFKSNGIPHLGFWDHISDRCVFIPRIKKQHVKDIAKKFKQDAYIWGERKKWWCFSTHDDDLLHSDHKLKIIAPDETFFWFTYILKGKQRIKMQITEMGKEQSNGNDSDRLTSLKRRLRDLEGLEKNLFSGSMSLY